MTNDRVVPLQGASNFRDLGDYPSVDGRRTRWGTLFRSDSLRNITPEDVVTLHSLRIKTIVDLRSHSEIIYAGAGPLEDSGFALIETDTAKEILIAPRSSGDTSLDDVYWRYLTHGAPRFARALRELSNPEAYPAVVSCFFGKDRTGVLTALVLDCIGVERDAIIDDYALSARRMATIVGRLREDPIYRETLALTPDWRMAAQPSSMSAFLRRLDRVFGGARPWALHAGVTQEHCDILRETLLE